MFAAPAEVFAAITAIDRLPDWNARIAKIIRPPSATPLAAGADWTVQMSVASAHWPSRSRVVGYDPERGYFDYVSLSDDGNPSYVVWKWLVEPDSGGVKVTVAWAAQPKTFWRRLLFARIRRRQLRHEVAVSLDALSDHLVPETSISQASPRS